MNEHIEDILVGGRPMTKLERANKEIERLKESEEYHRKGYAELYRRIDEAIEYIEENCTEHGEGKWAYRTINADNVLDILKEGDDKE